MWHLPGGMIRKGEKMIDAVKRISLEELGSTPKTMKFFGTYESLSKFRHDISQCYVVSLNMRKISFENNLNLKFFPKIPKNTIPFQKLIVKNWIKEFKQ